MVIVMRRGAGKTAIQAVVNDVKKQKGLKPHEIKGVERTVVACTGPITDDLVEHYRMFTGVKEVKRISSPHKLSSKESHPGPFSVTVAGVRFGQNEKKVPVVAGPCSVESRDQIVATAKAVKSSGASMVRGGVFKPRTSPFSFQGLGYGGVEHLDYVQDGFDLPVVSEVMDVENVEMMAEHVDILQCGARNMQNYPLLKALGQVHKPVLFKRHPGARLYDFLHAADYILSGGNQNVILCLRGINCFDSEAHHKNYADLADIPRLKQLTHLPIVFDPSHAVGYADRVIDTALMAIAGGADGLIVEVHPNPREALSDPGQQLNFQQFGELMERARKFAQAIGRTI